MKRFLLAALAMSAMAEAAASCGSAFCMINTNWNAQGQWTEPGARFDLRFEYIDQDQLRAGNKKAGIGEFARDHDEIRTINRNWFGTFDYTFSNDWGVSATLPVVSRFHHHLQNEEDGSQTPETWSFTEIGDARVLGRRQWHTENADKQRMDFFGLNFGLKLPTGRTDVANSEGELAERTLQPGTGTSDLLVGGYFSRVLGSGSSWFADLLVQTPLNSHDNFKPGTRSSVDLGYRKNVDDKLGLMLQLNFLHKARDSGSDAEPEDSGGKFLFLSPGVSYMLTQSLQAYGFVQLPLYQYVNGVQLTADWAVAAGLSWRF